MATSYWVTWQCADNDSGQYFLTKIPNGHIELTVDQIMDLAFAIEEVEKGTNYEIASIIRTEGHVDVVY